VRDHPVRIHVNGTTPERRIIARRSSSAAEYVDVQKGHLLIGVLAITSASTLIASVVWPYLILSLLLLAQLASAVCFWTLFIRVREGHLFWQFGPGWIRGKVALHDIIDSSVVTTRLAYGWGFEPRWWGWRFDRSKALALVIHLRGGKRLRLGTSRAWELQHFLRSRHAHL
jgi:hypothetical protein